MQRERVSKDKAISRSEYRQTEGIVLYADTRTHTQQKIGTDRKDGLLDPRMKFTTQRENQTIYTGKKSEKFKKENFKTSNNKALKLLEASSVSVFSNSLSSLHTHTHTQSSNVWQKTVDNKTSQTTPPTH